MEPVSIGLVPHARGPGGSRPPRAQRGPPPNRFRAPCLPPDLRGLIPSPTLLRNPFPPFESMATRAIGRLPSRPRLSPHFGNNRPQDRTGHRGCPGLPGSLVPVPPMVRFLGARKETAP